MGSIAVPTDSTIYLDANSIIYSGERVLPYYALLQTVWQAASAGACVLITSELSLLEVLVGPLKRGDAQVAADFRRLLLSSSDMRLIPITIPILEIAATLRSTIPPLKTPDAVHAATALHENCSLLITNDAAFRRVPGLNVTILSDLLAP